MINIYTGKPRTGKSYRAVKYIYDSFMNPKSKEYTKYHFLYTNIGGFKFDDVNDVLIESPIGIDNQVIKKEVKPFRLKDIFVYISNLFNMSPDKKSNEYITKEARPFKFRDFYKHLSKLYKMSLDEKDDEELLKYMQYHNLSPALYVFDESYKYFKKTSDPVLVWFLAYHGHLGVDVLMIIHDIGLMSKDYTVFTELYLEAQLRSKSLRDNQLRYHHYASSTFNKDNKFHTDSLTMQPEIHALYKSGDEHEYKKIVYKFIAGFALSIALLVFTIASLFPDSEPETVEELAVDTTRSIPTLSKQDNHNPSFTDLLSIRCDDSYCWNSNPDFEDKQISYKYFQFIVLKHNLELQYSEVKNEIYKLKPLKRGQQKILLASLTDYYYLIPPDLKKSFLSDFYIPRKKIIDSSDKKSNKNSSINIFESVGNGVNGDA